MLPRTYELKMEVPLPRLNGEAKRRKIGGRVISKDDAKKVWTGNDAAATEAIELRVDKAIREGGHIFVDLSGITLTQRVREKVASSYSSGGWTVKWTFGDCRDPGPYLELK